MSEVTPTGLVWSICSDLVMSEVTHTGLVLSIYSYLVMSEVTHWSSLVYLLLSGYE